MSAHRTPRRVDTWQLAAASVLLVVTGLGALVVTAPAPPRQPTYPTSTPTASSTATPAPVEPVRTRTPDEPDPIVTITAPPAPAPTKTVTVTPSPTTASPSTSPSATPSDSPTDPASPTAEPECTPGGDELCPDENGTEPTTDPDGEPLGLQVAPDVAAGWQVARAAATWNRVTGCRMFRVGLAVPGTENYAVLTGADLRVDGQPVWALHTYRVSVQLDPAYGVVPGVVVHELGHALGLQHSDDPTGVMNVSHPATERVTPSAQEIADVRLLNRARCA